MYHLLSAVQHIVWSMSALAFEFESQLCFGSLSPSHLFGSSYCRKVSGLSSFQVKLNQKMHRLTVMVSPWGLNRASPKKTSAVYVA